MGQIIPLPDRTRLKAAFEGAFTDMLKDVAEIKREELETEDNSIFHLNVSFEDLFKAKIGSFIIDHRLLNADLFRCSLYVAHILSETLSKKITSFYITDYLVRGIEDEDPVILKEGPTYAVLSASFLQRGRTGG